MKNRTRGHAPLLRLLTLGFLLAGATGPARGQVAVFPTAGASIQTRGEVLLIEMDRTRGLIHLTSNALLVAHGTGSFAVLVPTHAQPALTDGSDAVWNEARAFTSSHWAVEHRCAALFFPNYYAPPLDNSLTPGFDGVTSETSVAPGALNRAVIAPADPDAAARWLTGRGFQVDANQQARLRAYAERGWYFTAMWPDSAHREGYWTAQLGAVTLTFPADSSGVSLPLDLLRGSDPTLLAYVVDRHRVAAAGLQTSYANRLNDREYAALRREYPALAARIPPGAFVTRLQTAPFSRAPDTLVSIVRASDDQELQTVLYAAAHDTGFPADALLLASLPVTILVRRIRARRARR